MALRPLGEFVWRRIAGAVLVLAIVVSAGDGWTQETPPAADAEALQQRLIDEASQLTYVPPTNIVGQPENWGLGLQTASSPVADRVQDFHTLLLVIIFAIALFVLGLLLYVMRRFSASRNPTPSKTSHNTKLEVVWTVVPIIILLIIVFPSMTVLYFMDRTENPEMTLAVYGYQWNWGYEYPDQQIEEFISNPVPDSEITEGQVRLLSTTDPVVLPVDTNIQVLVRAGDVLHSWAVPAFARKKASISGSAPSCAASTTPSCRSRSMPSAGRCSTPGWWHGWPNRARKRLRSCCRRMTKRNPPWQALPAARMCAWR